MDGVEGWMEKEGGRAGRRGVADGGILNKIGREIEMNER